MPAPSTANKAGPAPHVPNPTSRAGTPSHHEANPVAPIFPQAPGVALAGSSFTPSQTNSTPIAQTAPAVPSQSGDRGLASTHGQAVDPDHVEHPAFADRVGPSSVNINNSTPILQTAPAVPSQPSNRGLASTHGQAENPDHVEYPACADGVGPSSVNISNSTPILQTAPAVPSQSGKPGVAATHGQAEYPARADGVAPSSVDISNDPCIPPTQPLPNPSVLLIRPSSSVDHYLEATLGPESPIPTHSPEISHGTPSLVGEDIDWNAVVQYEHRFPEGGAQRYQGHPPVPGSPGSYERTSFLNDDVLGLIPIPPNHYIPRPADFHNFDLGDDWNPMPEEEHEVSQNPPHQDDGPPPEQDYYPPGSHDVDMDGSGADGHAADQMDCTEGLADTTPTLHQTEHIYEETRRSSSPSGSNFSDNRRAIEGARQLQRSKGRQTSDTEVDDAREDAEMLLEEVSVRERANRTRQRRSTSGADERPPSPPRLTQAQKGKHRLANVGPQMSEGGDDELDIDGEGDVDGRDYVDGEGYEGEGDPDSEDDQRGMARGRLPAQALVEIEEFSRATLEYAAQLGKRWRRPSSDIIQRGRLGIGFARAPNPANEFRSWFCAKNQKPADSKSSSTNFSGLCLTSSFTLVTTKAWNAHVTSQYYLAFEGTTTDEAETKLTRIRNELKKMGKDPGNHMPPTTRMNNTSSQFGGLVSAHCCPTLEIANIRSCRLRPFQNAKILKSSEASFMSATMPQRSSALRSSAGPKQ